MIAHGGLEGDKPLVLTIQQDGGFAKTVERGTEAVERLLPQRRPRTARAGPRLRADGGAPVRRLGRLVGRDRQPRARRRGGLLVRQGGTVVLGETTEVYGGEHLLTRRAGHPRSAQELIDRIHWWEQLHRVLRRLDRQQPGARATSWAG